MVLLSSDRGEGGEKWVGLRDTAEVEQQVTRKRIPFCGEISGTQKFKKKCHGGSDWIPIM